MDYDEDDEMDEELQAALALSREEALARPAAPAEPQPAAPPTVQPLGGFKSKFRCYAASAAGRKELEATGKVILSQACLAALVQQLGGMPPTLLLRLSHGGSSIFVGVAEFVEDGVTSHGAHKERLKHLM